MANGTGKSRAGRKLLESGDMDQLPERLATMAAKSPSTSGQEGGPAERFALVELDVVQAQVRNGRYSRALPTSSSGMVKPATAQTIGSGRLSCSSAPAWKKPPRATT
jgi:hypothetical protein